MGEVNNTRKAQMLIIAATTVEPQSTMLPTFEKDSGSYKASRIA